MKKLTILVLIFTIFCSCEKEKKQEYQYKKNIKLRSEIQELVIQLSLYSSISGRETNASENKDFKRLLDIATNQELIELTDYEFARIRCYAFRGLVEKKYPKVKEIFYKHKNDIAKINVSYYDVLMPNTVNRYFLERLHPANNQKYKFTRIEYDNLMENLQYE